MTASSFSSSPQKTKFVTQDMVSALNETLLAGQSSALFLLQLNLPHLILLCSYNRLLILK